MIGFDKDAGNTEYETDTERWLSQLACQILRLPDEEQGTGKATQQGEEKEIGELPVCSLDNGGVAKLDENAEDEGSQEYTQYGEHGEGDPKRLCPGQKLDLFGDAECMIFIGKVVCSTFLAVACIYEMWSKTEYYYCNMSILKLFITINVNLYQDFIYLSLMSYPNWNSKLCPIS